VVAAIDFAGGAVGTVTDDLATAVAANRRHLCDGAFKAAIVLRIGMVMFNGSVVTNPQVSQATSLDIPFLATQMSITYSAVNPVSPSVIDKRW
jgi:hypothetical protein